MPRVTVAIVWLMLLAAALAAPAGAAAESATAAPAMPAEAAPVRAAHPDAAAALAALTSDDPDARAQALDDLGRSRDIRAIAALDDFAGGSLVAWNGRVAVSGGGDPAALLDPLTRAAIGSAPAAELVELSPSRRERVLARAATTLLRFADPDRDRRIAALRRAGDSGDVALLPALTAAAADEPDAKARATADESILLLRLRDPAPESSAAVAAAATRLGELASSRAMVPLRELAAAKDRPEVAAAAAGAIAAIERWQQVGKGVGWVFSSLSLGSILVLMALGLSIVFGLMGVINMAHGELMMIGAYATFLTQQAFAAWFPGAMDAYLLAAVPLAFLSAALVGWLIEATIVRHLYGRPLETLLATWGVSLLLIQAVRLWFGDNIAVNSPSWLQGGAEVARDIVLPYNRCFIIGFCFACIVGMWLLTERTRLGLLLRATSQNRRMAATLGVATRRVDAFTFALGSGIAGLAGCALTQIGGVTPDMGQNYIVDSFMVVVAGGVGKLAGAIVAGLGLGFLNKGLEPWTQAVWAKVIILGCVIVLLQWRPSGLFPAKGRLADA